MQDHWLTEPFAWNWDEVSKVTGAFDGESFDDFEDQPLHGTFVIDGKGRVLWTDISADPFMDIDFLIEEANRLLELHP